MENLGTDIHAAIQHTVETGEINFHRIEARYDEPEVERAKALWAAGLKLVTQARSDMKNPQFEVKVEFETEKYSLTGHVDILDTSPTAAYVVDFKTGRTRDDHYHQMAGYAVGAWTKMGRPEQYTVHVAYAYLDASPPEITTIDFDVPSMKAWMKELDSLEDRYTVNRRCVYCPLNDTCKTFRTYLKGSMQLLADTVKEVEYAKDFRALPEELKSKIVTAMKMADTSIKRIREHIKEDAIKNGPIKLGNGNDFAVKLRSRSILLTSRALPVVAKYVTARDISNATKLNQGDLFTAAARRVKGPMRKVILDEMRKKLEEAGAIVTTDSAYLETVPTPKETKCRKISKKK
jgi:hypothetical protein